LIESQQMRDYGDPAGVSLPRYDSGVSRSHGFHHHWDVEHRLVVHDDENPGLEWNLRRERQMCSADGGDGPRDEPGHRLYPSAEGRNPTRRPKPGQRGDYEPLDRIGYEEPEADEGQGEISSELHVGRLRRDGAVLVETSMGTTTMGTR